MTTLTLIVGAWALYLLGYAVGKARGYEDGMMRSWTIHEVTIKDAAEAFRKVRDAE